MKQRLTVAVLLGLVACAPGERGAEVIEIPPEVDERILAISERFVFADMHAHPSRFHRANVDTIAAEEIALYSDNHMSLVVANISSDMAYSGNYFNRDDSRVERGKYKPEAGDVFALAFDRLQRLGLAADRGYTIPALEPGDALSARRQDKVAVIAALEGADAFEGRIENLQRMYEEGLRLVQIVHFRANELGHIQTYPYSPGGLTEFGEEVIAEANRLGIIIDLAHCNTETIMDALERSSAPVIFSHGGLKALHDQDRALSDDEVRAIAAHGGVVGIWPHGRYIENIPRMVDFIEHAIEVAGPDHVGIGSDLRGTSAVSRGFGPEANFRAIAMEMLERGWDEETVGKVMGGNFFRVWQTVAGNATAGQAAHPAARGR